MDHGSNVFALKASTSMVASAAVSRLPSTTSTQRQAQLTCTLLPWDVGRDGRPPVLLPQRLVKIHVSPASIDASTGSFCTSYSSSSQHCTARAPSSQSSFRSRAGHPCRPVVVVSLPPRLASLFASSPSSSRFSSLFSKLWLYNTCLHAGEPACWR